MSRNSLRFVSRLEAPSAPVWASISTMGGVNYELLPLVRMTYPRQADAMQIADAPLGEVAFHSYVMLFGVLPLDRHALTLQEILPGSGFIEDSTSLLQRRWRHERRIVPDGQTRCLLSDDLIFEPRLALFTPLIRRIVRAVFDHRHSRLHKKFGGQRVQSSMSN
jgi:ligand-binding SRPBCC domain-containing protein